MKIKLSLDEGLAREFKIEIKVEEIKARVDAKLTEISNQVKMPGFRPGKVPISVVRARYGEQSKGEVIQTMLDEAAREAIETNDLNLASQPSLDIKKYEDGNPWLFLTQHNSCPIDRYRFCRHSIARLWVLHQ